jgi:nucleoside-triphosphatase THEP1
MSTETEGSLLELAFQYVRYTDRNIFLTGKAGTGKTSFLHRVRREVMKRMVVLAPTGVSAIHAGGVTIHSFFQLAPSMFLPELPHEWGRVGMQVTTPETVLRQVRYAAQKKELIEDLELIIIDEVSMVRSDLVDAIDTILRQVRRRFDLPFGGVQMLFIGDLFQLPPVVKPEDWELMKLHYESPFFFDARVLRQYPPVCMELKKIFRQDDEVFIRILNAIRNNEAGSEDLAAINRHYRPGGVEEEGLITLTTHNAKADLMNHRALGALPGEVIHFDAVVEGDFPDKSFPAEQRISLKVGARIMFIRNDKGESRRYFNGKLATVDRIEDGQKIFVIPDGEEGEMELEAETWKNIRYRYDKVKERVDEEELGSYRQFPIRLAWAITIHKGQGLTFERAVIDAGESFSPGQVYVALSRLTGLSGLVLKSRIHPGSIHTDPRVLAFARQEPGLEVLNDQLEADKRVFIHKTILLAFDFEGILRVFTGLLYQQGTMFSADEEGEGPEWLKASIRGCREMQSTSVRFSVQLRELIATDGAHGYVHLVERCGSAWAYFKSRLASLQEVVGGEIRALRLKRRQTKPLAWLRSVETRLALQERLMQQTVELSRGLAEGRSVDHLIAMMDMVQERAGDMSLVEESQPRLGGGPVRDGV